MNMNDPRTNPEAEGGEIDPRLPAELVNALRREESRWKLAVPADRDEQVLGACREELNQRLVEAGKGGSAAGSSRDGATGVSPFRDSPRPQPKSTARIIPFPRVWPRWAAAAAAVFALGLFLIFRQRPQPVVQAINVEQPTVVDALALARLVETGAAIDPHLDLDGDGAVGLSDASLLAQRAVQLPAGGAL
jgi:hypothetical protein